MSNKKRRGLRVKAVNNLTAKDVEKFIETHYPESEIKFNSTGSGGEGEFYYNEKKLSWKEFWDLFFSNREVSDELRNTTKG